MPIRALVWGENVHEHSNAHVAKLYPDGMHNTIAAALRQDAGLEADTATLQDPEHGLPEARLAQTDVLLWWGHAAHGQVADAVVERVANRIWEGMGLIVLHSGHFSKIFKRLMGTPCSLKWREAGERERVWVVNKSHPIAQGLPPAIEIPNTEMYGEPFTVPEPAETVFISWYEGGEVFRSGLTWQRGGGRIFYFSPGHETYPIYHQPEIGQVLRNAVRWAHNRAPRWTGIALAPNAPVETAPERIEKSRPAPARRRRRGAALKPVRILILGAGAMAEKHAEYFGEVEGCSIAAVVDVMPERLDAFCTKYNVPRSFADLNEALGWGEFDAVANVTPDAVHYPSTMQLVEAGKPIFCEKPLAPSYPQALEMTEAVERRGIVNMVNLRYRGLPVMQMARALVEDGMLGEVRHIDASYLQSWLVGTHWGDWRTEERWLWRLSGAHGSRGVLGDVGIHILDFASYVADQDPVSVHCRMKSFGKADGDRIGAYALDVNDSFVMSIEFDGGALGVVHASRWATGYANAQKVAVFGTQGALEIWFENEASGLRICAGGDIHTQTWREVDCPPVPNTYQSFVDAVRRGESNEPTFRRATDLQRVLDLCFASSDSGQAVPVSATPA